MNIFIDKFVQQLVKLSDRSRALHRSWVHAWMAVGTLAAVGMVWWGGSIFSPSLLWLAIMPNAALFFLSQTATMAWLSIVMVVLIAVSLTAQENMLHMQEVMMGMSGLGVAMHLVLAQLALMMIHLVYDWQYRQKSSRIAASISKMKAVQNKLQVTEIYKDRFIATVSEDLRSPMNAILGYSDVLADMATHKPDLNDTVQHIRTSIQQLLDMTNNILDHAQLNAGQLNLNFRPMSLQQVIQNEWAQWSVGAEVEFKIVVQKNMPTWLWCDEDRFKQIVSILLGNAKKFTSQGQVLLQFSHQAGMLQIDIRDTGVGITDDVKAYIFKRFDQGDESMQHKFGGIGLGLANALALTHLFGGTIGFESQNSHGSHFWVRLPVRQCDWTQVQKDHADDPEARRLSRILIIDDEPLGQLVMAQAIRKVWPQAQITQASNGEQALKSLQDADVDVVLMNGWMTHAEAGEWGLKIRQDMASRHRATALIGVTASTHQAAKAQMMVAGMDEVIVKPVDPQQLSKTILKLVKTSQDAEKSALA
jgi:signal transduction histidine kinase/AmiR/NasT family two-component response regulator